MTTCVVGGHVVITAVGEIDIDTAPKLREQVAMLVGAGHYHLILDLERVEFMDSTGLSCLMSGLRRVRAKCGSLRVVCTRDPICRLFRFTGLTAVFPAHANVHAAITATDAFA